MTRADLKHCGKIQEAREELNRSVREGRIESMHSIKSLEGMGSSSHDLGTELRMHSFTVNCDTFSNEKKLHLHVHNFCIKQDKDTTTDYIIDQQYADDIGFNSNNKNIISKAIKNIAPILEERNLTISEKKQYNIRLTELKNDWKKCKYLGTLLDTETDIQRRKNLTYIAFNKYRHTLTCRNLPLYLRIRLFDVFVASIFMYNFELWTLTKSQ